MICSLSQIRPELPNSMNSSASSGSTSSGDARTDGRRRRSSKSRSVCASAAFYSIIPIYHRQCHFRMGFGMDRLPGKA